jgi:hypothetical protein
MMKTLAIAAAALFFAAQAQAQAAASSPAKKELVAKVLQLQQPGVEAFAREIVQRNALQILQGAGRVLQERVPADRREAIAKDIQADTQKFAEDSLPLVRDRAVKLAPSTIGVLLEERFTEDELRQVIQILESPVNRKFQGLAGEMQRSLGEKLMAEVRPLLEPRVRALDQTIARRLGITPPAAAGSGPK